MAKADAVSFALRSEYADDFAGASLVLGSEGRTVDLKARLDNGKGTITTSDPVEIEAFRDHGALKEVPASGGKS